MLTTWDFIQVVLGSVGFMSLYIDLILDLQVSTMQFGIRQTFYHPDENVMHLLVLPPCSDSGLLLYLWPQLRHVRMESIKTSPSSAGSKSSSGSMQKSPLRKSMMEIGILTLLSYYICTHLKWSGRLSMQTEKQQAQTGQIPENTFGMHILFLNNKTSRREELCQVAMTTKMMDVSEHQCLEQQPQFQGRFPSRYIGA